MVLRSAGSLSRSYHARSHRRDHTTPRADRRGRLKPARRLRSASAKRANVRRDLGAAHWAPAWPRQRADTSFTDASMTARREHVRPWRIQAHDARRALCRLGLPPL
eukprot:4536876-Prymnesium_polylepis.2